MKIIVAEDNELFRTSLVIALESQTNIELVAVCKNGIECLKATAAFAPDLILMDLSMPVMNGIEACKSIKEKYPNIKVLMFSAHEDSESVLACLKAQANAYCTKETNFQKLFEVIKTVMEGAAWLDPAIASYIQNFLEDSQSKQRSSSEFKLSDRELEILALMAEGKSNKEIAERLFITSNTVKAHVGNIIQKLSARSRTEAAVIASKNGSV